MFAQGQGYNLGPSPLPRAPLPRYTYPQVSHQARRSKETGGHLLSGYPSTIQQVYSIDASYGQQANQAQNYSHAYQNVVPSGISEATSSRPYVQPAQNVVPERAMTAVMSNTMVPCERNMTLVTMDASSSQHGGSASSLAVKPAQQASELFHAGAPVEAEAFRTALPQSRPSPSREERPIPAKKVIAWTMNKTDPTRTCQPPSVSTSHGSRQLPFPSTSSISIPETTNACCSKCPGCSGDSHSYSDDLRGSELGKISSTRRRHSLGRAAP
ncbi:hypothetical protein MRX96_028196 [Rhipicephalus microplus]